MTAARKLDEESTGREFFDYEDSASPDMRRLYGHMLHADLVLFAKDILRLEIGPHLVAWGDLVATTQRIAVNAARDHSKSTFFSYAYPIWRAWAEPGCEVYLFSKTLDQAAEFLDIILYGRANLRGMVDIPELQHLVPSTGTVGKRDPRARMNRTDVRLTNGSRIRVAGYGKAMRGRHPKYIVLDDPLNDEDMWSETTRRKNTEYFKSAITNMLPPDGQLIVVGTPYHMNDLYGFLRQNEMYTFVRYPAILKDIDGKERALFPWRWTLARLHEKKKEIGSVAFAREILCQPVSDDISIFPSFLFPPCYDHKLTLKMSRADILRMGWTCFMGVDIARSASVSADFFVVFVVAKAPDGRHVIVDISRTKGLSFNAQLELMKSIAERYDPALIHIESNAAQQVYSDEMRRTTDLPVKEFVTLASNKYPLDRGVPSLRLLLESGKLVIPRGDERSRQITDAWIEECTQFGFIDGKMQGIGAHDDMVMGWWLAEEAVKAGGFSFTFGENSDDKSADDEMTGGGADGENWLDVLVGKDDGDARDDLDFGSLGSAKQTPAMMPGTF